MTSTAAPVNNKAQSTVRRKALWECGDTQGHCGFCCLGNQASNDGVSGLPDDDSIRSGVLLVPAAVVIAVARAVCQQPTRSRFTIDWITNPQMSCCGLCKQARQSQSGSLSHSNCLKLVIVAHTTQKEKAGAFEWCVTQFLTMSPCSHCSSSFDVTTTKFKSSKFQDKEAPS